VPLTPRTERILKRTSIGVSIVVGFADLLILGFFAWFPVYFLVLKEDTLYSPGYSEAGFDQVKAGMTEPEVKDLLGLPLRVTADWYVRAVTFTPQWVVSKVRKSYYVD